DLANLRRPVVLPAAFTSDRSSHLLVLGALAANDWDDVLVSVLKSLVRRKLLGPEFVFWRFQLRSAVVASLRVHGHCLLVALLLCDAERAGERGLKRIEVPSLQDCLD